MKLILVRHGETHWNKDGLVQGGDSDIELNDTGLEQAGKIAAFLKNEPIIAILSSPLQRAVATAEVIASQHQLSVEIDQGLKELKVGDLEGIPISNLRTTFSRFLLQWWQDGEAMKLPNGESLVELQQRAWKVIEGLLEKHKGWNGGSSQPLLRYLSHHSQSFKFASGLLYQIQIRPWWGKRS